MKLTERITYLKKISNDRTKGDIFERTTGNILFIGIMDNVADELLSIAERASTAVNQMICTCAFITRCEKCELHEVLEKLRETK